MMLLSKSAHFLQFKDDPLLPKNLKDYYLLEEKENLKRSYKTYTSKLKPKLKHVTQVKAVKVKLKLRQKGLHKTMKKL